MHASMCVQNSFWLSHQPSFIKPSYEYITDKRVNDWLKQRSTN